MRTSEFQFNISGKNINSEIKVNGVAIEIDGGYESKNKVILVEAKNYIPEDFIIRQLYYPYRYWESKIQKEIIPVFFTYDNGIYNMFIYCFEDLYNYNSLKLKNIKRFMISNNNSEKIKKEILANSKVTEELSQKTVPLPQADSFSKVICVLELISNNINTASLIAKEINFDERQGKYYIDALRYLRLVKKSNKKGKYEITNFGIEILKDDIKTRNQKKIIEILKHKPFNETYKFYIENETMPDKEFIKERIKNNIPNMSDETINRRASTIRGWIWWIIGAHI